jgi:hypothetical protein
MQKRAKISPSNASGVNPPGDLAQRVVRQAQFLGQQVERGVAWAASMAPAPARCARARQRLQVARARDEHALGPACQPARAAGARAARPARRRCARTARCAPSGTAADAAARRACSRGAARHGAPVLLGMARGDGGGFGGFVVGLARRVRSCRKQHRVGVFDVRPSARDADALDLVAGARRAQAGGVEHVQRHAFDLDGLLHHVARGAGNGGDDGQLGPRQRVQQAALAGVGLAGDAPP